MTFPQPDPRMAYFSGGLGPDGVPVPISVERLQKTAGRWATTDTTPSGVADLLRVSRSLFIYSYFVYDFATVGVAWSLLAVETALRQRLNAGSHARFAHLIDRAADDSLISPAHAEALHAGRKLRNDFSHPQRHPVWPPGMTGRAMAESHGAVAMLYPNS